MVVKKQYFEVKHYQQYLVLRKLIKYFKNQPKLKIALYFLQQILVLPLNFWYKLFM